MASKRIPINTDDELEVVVKPVKGGTICYLNQYRPESYGRHLRLDRSVHFPFEMLETILEVAKSLRRGR